MKDNRYNPAFTLIELLIVSAILAIVAMAAYSVFNSGIKIWAKVNTNIEKEDVDIFLDRFASDLRDSFNFADMHFLGLEDRFEFTTLVYSPRTGKRTIGRVVYSYDSGAEELNREAKDFSHIYSDESGMLTDSLGGITSLVFRYYVYDPQVKEYDWADEWLEETLPQAVRIELEFNNGARTDESIKTVSIPVSG